MAMSGESRLERTHGRPLLSQRLVYNWLDDLPTAVPWRVYYDGPFPFFTLMPDWAPAIGGDIVLDGVGFPGRFRRYERFAEDWFWDPDLPPVVFIEPEYTDAPHRDADDDHPPTSIGAGQKFLHSIYTALISRPDRWAKTLLIVTYDEHGGFFDHEPPLAGRTDPRRVTSIPRSRPRASGCPPS
jgi:phospholipase C